ncbi:glucuronyl esterase domain-containing protein [Dyadobacter luticola]|uniref:Acetylxylan esterase n=1 Tax=Dyadobacter luticola TaxID=1979387 RepID=A0A5R9KS51_9BACT|nr:acetylxylan esterase [Dyadobacter luticola]TLU98959.1 acetylxylan esterase [Dyadobacter luticola]
MLKAFFTFIFLIFTAVAGHAQNYDESKVPSYILPDVLKTSSGKKVKSVKTWEKERRPEILKMFENNIYGQMPMAYDSVRRSITTEEGAAMGGKAKLKQVTIEVFKNRKSVKIDVVLFTPTKATGPVPVFLLINNRPNDNTDPTRQKKSEFWPAEMVIDSGFAIAAFHVNDLAPDNKDTYMNGVLQLYPEQLKADNGMKAIGAWAWGASRVMDYFEKDADIDAKKVIVVGHSRGGKASLWAAAEDQRFAACVTNCSGNSGAALARRQFGERISRINTTFPHWFNNNYKKFNDKENSLPVDQHMLIALIAPRPVYATNASKDLWADPKGTYLSLKNAESVYNLYKIKSQLPATPPAINVPLPNPPLGYHIREGEHNMTEFDWREFLVFAKGI